CDAIVAIRSAFRSRAQSGIKSRIEVEVDNPRADIPLIDTVAQEISLITALEDVLLSEDLPDIGGFEIEVGAPQLIVFGSEVIGNRRSANGGRSCRTAAQRRDTGANDVDNRHANRNVIGTAFLIVVVVTTAKTENQIASQAIGCRPGD